MYYLLDKRFRLCGWERLPYAVVDRQKGAALFVEKPVMDTLELCSGSVDFDLPLIPQSMRDMAAEMEKRDLIHSCSPGEKLEEKQKYTLYPNRYMQTVHWSVTGRCNCKCKHCYMSAPDAKYGELPHGQVMEIIDQMGKSGVLRCSITGGEALVRSDFWDIVDALLAQEIVITQIYSNGLLVNERLLDGLAQRGIRPEINMSFDGTGTHDWLRGIPGAEAAVRRAFLLCREKGFPTGAEMCMWRGNLHTLRTSINDLAAMGCRSLKTTPIADTGAWKEGNYEEQNALKDDELFSVYFDYLDAFYEDLPPMQIHLGGFFLADGRNPDQYILPAVHHYQNPMRASMCVHARNHMYISAEGRAMPCMGLASMEESFLNRYPLVQETGFQQCITDSAYMELIDMRAEEIIAHNEKCRDCEYKDTCLGGCRASAMSVHPGDVLAPDEMTCRFYRDGWLQRIKDKAAKLHPVRV